MPAPRCWPGRACDPRRHRQRKWWRAPHLDEGGHRAQKVTAQSPLHRDRICGSGSFADGLMVNMQISNAKLRQRAIPHGQHACGRRYGVLPSGARYEQERDIKARGADRARPRHSRGRGAATREHGAAWARRWTRCREGASVQRAHAAAGRGLARAVMLLLVIGATGSQRSANRQPAPRRSTWAARHLLPSFIDVRVNGGGGQLFNDDPSVETIRVIAETHRRCSTTGLLPTLISDAISPVVEAGIRAMSAAIEGGAFPGCSRHPYRRAFLNPARRGIQRRQDPAAARRIPGAAGIDRERGKRW